MHSRWRCVAPRRAVLVSRERFAHAIRPIVASFQPIRGGWARRGQALVPGATDGIRRGPCVRRWAQRVCPGHVRCFPPHVVARRRPVSTACTLSPPSIKSTTCILVHLIIIVVVVVAVAVAVAVVIIIIIADDDPKDLPQAQTVDASMAGHRPLNDATCGASQNRIMVEGIAIILSPW